MSNPNRGSFIDVSYQVIYDSFGPTVSEKIFLEIDQPETRIA